MMKNNQLWTVCFLAGFASLTLLLPEMALATGFETKMGNLRDNLIGVVLPLVSTIGLVYAAILAVSGSSESKGKVITVLVMSVVGFMAKFIIEFLKGAVG